MKEYIINVNESDERWHYVEQQYTHFFGYPITEQIVRCGDCKYYRFIDRSGVFNDDRHNDSYCLRFVDGKRMEVEPNGFCAWGEPRWLVCKCGEEIETTGGAFAVCQSCGRRVSK